MRCMKIELILLNDFITSGETQGSVIDVLRGPGNSILIPASHFKGVLRSEAERLVPGIIKDVEKVFGLKEQEQGRDMGRKYCNPSIHFTDLYCSDLDIIDNIQERAHVTIDTETDSSLPGALYLEKTVPKGSAFIGFIFIKEVRSESEKFNENIVKLLKAAAMSAGQYGFGRERSRGLGGAKIKIEDIGLDEAINILHETVKGFHGGGVE